MGPPNDSRYNDTSARIHDLNSELNLSNGCFSADFPNQLHNYFGKTGKKVAYDYAMSGNAAYPQHSAVVTGMFDYQSMHALSLVSV